MDFKDIVPTAVPDSEHPYAPLFLGLVTEGRESEAARRIFDDLGARITFPDETEVNVGWAVDVGTLKKRHKVMVGEPVDVEIPGADSAGVRIVAGHLPPGVRLERHTGKLVGTFTKPGLYDATFAVGPALKMDPLGGRGIPGEPVAWIPIHAERMRAESHQHVPPSLDSLSALELSALAAEAMRLERLKALEEAENGNPSV